MLTCRKCRTWEALSRLRRPDDRCDAVADVAQQAAPPEAALRQLGRIQHHRVRIDGAEPLAGISTIHQDLPDTLDALNIKKPSLDAQMDLL